ncbi:MAG: hypothetical protein VX278_12580, partial [Myxococcota bacterium]|nr:hypothetical protein [Myxococcota bacterium]
GDQPPVVTVDSTIQNKVPLNRVLGIRWAAKDDYGIERVVLEFEVNGELKSQVLKRPVELSQSISGRIMNSPSRLGLKSGDKVKLRVVAYDNQPEPLMDGEAPVSNPDPDAPIGKRGESGLIEFTVIGPKLRAKQLIESNKEFK